MRSNIPVVIELKLIVAGADESVTVPAGEALVGSEPSGTETRVDESFIRRVPGGAARSSRLQRVVATTPGWRLENDGLLHVRGVDDGVLFVIDGIPVVDRRDTVSASPFDAEAVSSMNVITGNIPAEFGGRSGAVAAVQTKSGIGSPLAVGFSVGGGNFRTGETAAASGGSSDSSASRRATAPTASSTRLTLITSTTAAAPSGCTSVRIGTPRTATPSCSRPRATGPTSA